MILLEPDNGCWIRGVMVPPIPRPVPTRTGRIFPPIPPVPAAASGLGLRLLKRDGRPNAVWVMVFLSDGLVNLSDTPLTNIEYPRSVSPTDIVTAALAVTCGAMIVRTLAKTEDLTPRYCLDNHIRPPARRVPFRAWPISALYSVYDYALDMIDYAALQQSDQCAGAIQGRAVILPFMPLDWATPAILLPEPAVLSGNICCATWQPWGMMATGKLTHVLMVWVCMNRHRPIAVSIIMPRPEPDCAPSSMKFPPVFIQG